MWRELNQDERNKLLGMTSEYNDFFRHTRDEHIAKTLQSVTKEQKWMQDHIDEYISVQIDVETEKSAQIVEQAMTNHSGCAETAKVLW